VDQDVVTQVQLGLVENPPAARSAAAATRSAPSSDVVVACRGLGLGLVCSSPSMISATR
jgi:hypothetical protein